MGLRLPTADTNFKQKQAALARFATNIYTLMGNATGLVNFPAPPVDLVTLVGAINAYTTSLGAAVKGSKTQTATKNINKKVLQGYLRSNAIYVSEVSQNQIINGSANATAIAQVQAFILTSGYKLSTTPGPVANVVGVALPIVKKAISKTAGTFHLLLRQYTAYKKGVKLWQLQYRTSAIPAHGSTPAVPAGPWLTQVFTSGNITAGPDIPAGMYDYQVGALGGGDTKLGVPNPINYTVIQQIVVT